MYEVEKNFDLFPGDKERLVLDAVFLEQKTYTDTYYDFDDWFLTSKDYWLRSRNGKFELKIPLNKEGIHYRQTDQYQEIESEQDIAQYLNLELKNTLIDTLRKVGCRPFVTIVTNRESYKKQHFKLDFDKMDFGFTTLEVELMVSDPEQIKQAEADIIKFAQENNIKATLGHGKVIEYLFRYDKKHYQALVDSGVVNKH